jgi:hypothetical protein
MEFYLATKKNEILSFTVKWMELENVILSEIRLRRPKAACSPLYADYRPKTNAAILWETGHTMGGRPQEKTREGKQNCECGCYAWSQYKNEYRNLKLAEAIMGRGLGSSEEYW